MKPTPILAGLAVLVLLGGGIWGGLSGFGAGAAAPEAEQGPTLPPRPPVTVVQSLPRLQATLEDMAERGRFTGGVLVARGDEVLFRQVYGMADREAGRAFTLDTPFRLASVSKMFTAAALLRLQDEGVLSVDDPVCRWIKPCPEAWADIRVGHLISHQSGIPDLMQRPGWGIRRTTPATLDELTFDSSQYRLEFEPGTDLRYNNAGFNLAAAVVESATGQDFHSWLSQTFFQPLGMTRTGYDVVPDLAMGYADFPAGITPQPEANVSIIPGAGALSSTLDDLLAWEWALHRGGLLSERSYAAMIADHAPLDTPDERRGGPRRLWGYGLFSRSLGHQVEPAFEDRQIYHTGSWSGFRNMVLWQPGAEIVVIVLSNNYHRREEVFLISQQAMAEALGRPYPERMAPRD
ncbi:serine hydrolase domain-containing protein [Brevundimonas sp. A19_0]|uniref:serine hydrolase domain-containing protein n=1 Tax=Brevundimonas sp. A19_0 TaxID=2821087 RepID=UPI001ADC31FD|nr:serine hydrolase domain-containing protein [Brevundimonas sp. A19_0]MBO9502374.1 beta-lactamase family protein [Brevundimonas sp. A19_0]